MKNVLSDLNFLKQTGIFEARGSSFEGLDPHSISIFNIMPCWDSSVTKS